MKRDEFTKRYQEVRRWDNRCVLFLLPIGIGAYFAIPFCLKIAAPSPVLRVVFGVLILVVLMGPLVWVALAGGKMRDRLDLRCPHCGALFNQVTMKEAIDTGRCKRCGKMIFEDDHGA
jgi:phage FluMu protein Com